MKLTPAQCYETHDGAHVCIVGPTLHHDDLYWSLQADWYDAATGQRTFGEDGTMRRVSQWTTIARAVPNCLDYTDVLARSNARRAAAGRAPVHPSTSTET